LLAGCSLPALPAAPTSQSDPKVDLTLRPTIAQANAVLIPTAAPQIAATPTISATPLPPYVYTTQSGDYLANLAARFGVDPGQINSANPIPKEGLINPGQTMVIPRKFLTTAPSTLILPDSEVVYSPSSLDLDVAAFTKKAGGRLSKYNEYLANGNHTGADLILMVAQDNSINPRLLMALLEYQSHWITAQPGNLMQEEYPMGNSDINFRKLFEQLTWAARMLSIGYYGWRTGTLNSVTFPDGTSLRLSPEPNAGTVAVQYFFSRLYNQREWSGVLYSDNGFPAMYEKLFGSPWERAQTFEPLFPPNTVQPPLELPFYYDRIWSFSGGPHPAWSSDSPYAALDFAPGSTESGCITSYEWVVASAPGLVVRSDDGLVVEDLDGDGKEQTGWVLIYLHISSDKRVPVGTRLALNDPIGHPSCEGGLATGTHMHFARKYNGEWILADGPLPFVLSGWRAHAGSKEYEGTLTKNGQTITACTCGSNETKISRPRPSSP
jgi:LasA protease